MKKTLTELIDYRIRRREVLSMFGGGVLASCARPAELISKTSLANAQPNFSFASVPPTLDEMHHVSDGYEVDIVLSWGDPIFSSQDAPFLGTPLSAQEQERRFGFNCDYISCFPRENGVILLCGDTAVLCGVQSAPLIVRASNPGLFGNGWRISNDALITRHNVAIHDDEVSEALSVTGNLQIRGAVLKQLILRLTLIRSIVPLMSSITRWPIFRGLFPARRLWP